MKKTKECCSERLGKVGGQAVLEGVMMKAGEHTVTTCRKPDKTIVVTDDSFVSVRKKKKILNIPLLRGVINFVEMLILSMKTLTASAEALGIEEEEEEGKFAKWLKKHFKINLTDLVMAISLVLGLGLSVLLFIFLPSLISFGIDFLIGLIWQGATLGVFTAVVEGVVKVGIFLGYLSLVSLMPDIKRTFMYHGAEHKSIACFESGEELTPENAKKHTRFHPRCGTSFMFFMILLGIIAGLFIRIVFPGLDLWVYTLIRLLILPLLVGVGFEFIMLAGKHPNFITRALSAPGLWVQRITTKEPTLDMLEVAIVSLKCALRDEFPEFMEFYKNREWEPKQEEAPATVETADEAVEEIAEAAEVIEAAEATEVIEDTAADKAEERENDA